jgi:hypothetical protein
MCNIATTGTPGDSALADSPALLKVPGASAAEELALTAETAADQACVASA